MENQKKKSKFSSQELEVLIEEITMKVPQMMDSQQRGNIFPDTNSIWEDILNKVNRVATTERSIEDLKKKWHDLSQRVMEQIAELKKHSGITEDTSAADPQLTPFQEKVRQILLMANVEGMDMGAGEVIAYEPTAERPAEGKKREAVLTMGKTTEEKMQFGDGTTKDKPSEEEKQPGAGPNTERTAYVERKLRACQLPTQGAQSLSHSQSISPEPQNIEDSEMQQLQCEICQGQVVNVRGSEQNEELPQPSSSPPVHLKSQPDSGRDIKHSTFFENYARQLNLLEEYTHQVAQHTTLFLENNSLHNQLIGALTQHIKVTTDLNETITTFVLENHSVCNRFAGIANVPKPNWQKMSSAIQPQHVVTHRQDLRLPGGTLQEARSNSSVEMMRSPCRRNKRSRDRGLAPLAEKKQK